MVEPTVTYWLRFMCEIYLKLFQNSSKVRAIDLGAVLLVFSSFSLSLLLSSSHTYKHLYACVCGHLLSIACVCSSGEKVPTCAAVLIVLCDPQDTALVVGGFPGTQLTGKVGYISLDTQRLCLFVEFVGRNCIYTHHSALSRCFSERQSLLCTCIYRSATSRQSMQKRLDW